MNGYEHIAKFITTIGLIPAILVWVLWEVRTYIHAQVTVLSKISESLDLLIKLHQ